MNVKGMSTNVIKHFFWFCFTQVHNADAWLWFCIGRKAVKLCEFQPLTDALPGPPTPWLHPNFWLACPASLGKFQLTDTTVTNPPADRTIYTFKNCHESCFVWEYILLFVPSFHSPVQLSHQELASSRISMLSHEWPCQLKVSYKQVM